MAAPTVPGATAPISSDLATGDIRGRVAKILGERIARKLGYKWGTGDIGATLKPYISDLPIWATDALSIGGAAIATSPRKVAEWIGSVTTYDVSKVDELLNEAVDSGFQSFIAGVRGRAAGSTPSEADYIDAADKTMAALEAAGKFDLDRLSRKVVADGQNKIYHELNCPIVWKSQSTGKAGRDGASTTSKTLYKDGHKEVTLRWALTENYIPTPGGCCGKAAALVLDDVLKSKKDVFEGVDSLKTATDAVSIAARQSFYSMLSTATDDQRSKLRDIGSEKRWQPSELVIILGLASGQIDTFLNMIASKVVRPKKTMLERATGWVEKNWRHLLSPQAAKPTAQATGDAAQVQAAADTSDVDKVRSAVDAYSTRAHKGAVTHRREANAAEARFRR